MGAQRELETPGVDRDGRPDILLLRRWGGPPLPLTPPRVRPVLPVRPPGLTYSPPPPPHHE